MPRIKTLKELSEFKGQLVQAMSKARFIGSSTQKTIDPLRDIEAFILQVKRYGLGGDKGAMVTLNALTTHLNRAFDSNVKLLDFIKKKRRVLPKIESSIVSGFGK